MEVRDRSAASSSRAPPRSERRSGGSAIVRWSHGYLREADLTLNLTLSSSPVPRHALGALLKRRGADAEVVRSGASPPPHAREYESACRLRRSSPSPCAAPAC